MIRKDHPSSAYRAELLQIALDGADWPILSIEPLLDHLSDFDDRMQRVPDTSETNSWSKQ